MLSMQKLKLKTCLIKKYGTAKLSKLVPGETVNVKAPSDKGFKRLVVRKDNSPYCYQVGVDQSKVRKDRKHLFEVHSINSDNENVEIELPSFKENDGAAESS